VMETMDIENSLRQSTKELDIELPSLWEDRGLKLHERIVECMEACKHDDVEMLKSHLGEPWIWGREMMLLEGSVQSDAQDVRGKTLLMYAAGYSSMKCISYLLQHPCLDINAVDDSDKTALHHACRRTQTLRDHQKCDCYQANLVKLLCTWGANLDVQDHKGRTPMHIAVEVRIIESNTDDRNTDANTVFQAIHNLNFNLYQYYSYSTKNPGRRSQHRGHAHVFGGS
jgi:hypothetical protein